MKQMAGQCLERFRTDNRTYWKVEYAIWTLGHLAASCSAAPAWGVSQSPGHCFVCGGHCQCLSGSGCGALMCLRPGRVTANETGGESAPELVFKE